MPLTFPPVSVVASGGIPVTNSKLGAPMTVVPTGKGLPITLTTKALGAPFYLKNPDGSDYPDASQILGNSMLAWWNADRSDLMTTSGGMVSSWRDVKNGYDATQGVSASRPTYQATGFGGSPCVAFDGTDDNLTLTPNPFPVGADPVEVWSVARDARAGGDTIQRRLWNYGDSAVNARWVSVDAPSGTRFAPAYGDGTTTLGASPLVADTSIRFVARYVLSAPAPYNNFVHNGSGSTSGGANPPATVAARMRIGSTSYTSPAVFWQGPIRDLIFTTPLTTDQANALTTYLLARRNV